MKNNILVTGASGFIGSRLVDALNGRNYTVRKFDIDDGDIATTKLNFRNIHHVFHLAAKLSVPDSWVNPFLYYRVNIMGTANVLEYCRDNNCSLTFISTYVYGVPTTLPINEEHPIYPHSPYTHSKILAEELCKFYSEFYGLKITILRPFNIYGPKQQSSFLIPTLIKQALDKDIKVIEVMDLKPKRDYLYIEDFVDAMLLTINNDNSSIYNLGSGHSESVEDIIKIIIEITGNEKEYVSQNIERKLEVYDVVADISKIKNEFNWEPKYSIYEGIKKIIDIGNNYDK